MRRTTFLRAGGGAMVALALPPLHARVLAADTVEYALTAGPLSFPLLSGTSFAALAYNGSLPGPLLRVVHGQSLRVRYRNATAVRTAVHWHGMILPNAMDGVPGVTQAAVEPNGEFLYEFAPGPPGTRWYHDHGDGFGVMRGLFGMFVVVGPKDEPVDAEFSLVFHDIPKTATIEAAAHGTGTAPMVDPLGSPELKQMSPTDRMGDEVAYQAHYINGAMYPKTTPLAVKVGQRVRLRILNANLTQTRYVRLAGHRLHVTHADGNRLPQAIDVDALRIGVGERYDATFEVTKPGAWLLQGLSSDPLAYEQAVVVHTEGLENAPPVGSSQSLEGVDFFTYEKAGAAGAAPLAPAKPPMQHYVLDGGAFGSSRWTMNDRIWPDTPKIAVKRGDLVTVSFTNKSDMDHPMHLHGHTFDIVEVDGKALARPLAKDTSLVRANGGTMTWRFLADSPAGRWLLHCHNEVHMMDGLMTEVDYS